MYRYSRKPLPTDSNAPQIEEFKAFCPHCGNVTYQKLRALERDYRIYECNICAGVTFQIVHKEEVENTTPRSKKVTKIQERLELLWPPPSIMSDEVPERVREIYEEAIGIRTKSPSSFVVQIRRALEAVATERSAPPGSLYQRIEWMIQQNLLPNVFGEMIQITRMFGNLGAHDAEKDVKLEETEIVNEFFRAIIEYIYVAPSKVKKIKDLLL